jgi:hypothetical protein
MSRVPDSSFVVVAILFAGVSGCGTPGKMAMTPIGGAWHFYLHSSPIIEAGRKPTDLYRDWDGKPVLVASDTEFYKYYEEHDCMLWETSQSDHVVYAACGDREPIVVATDDYHRWTMEARGLVDEADARVGAAGAPVTPTVLYALDDIAEASARQPVFSGAWSPLRARADDGLTPTELDVPIDVDVTNEAGWTPLMVAASERNSSGVVGGLITQGANVNFTDKFGTTALMVAADRGHADVVRLLMDAGADIHMRTDDGSTALMKAAGALDNQVEMVTMLLDAGADKNLRNKYGNTAFSAIRTNTDPQLKVLLALQ